MPFIDPIPFDQAPPIVRRIYEATEHARGVVPNSQRTMAYNPEVLRAFGPFVGAISRENVLPNRLKELAILRVTLINGCRYCLAHHYHAATAAGVTLQEMLALGEIEQSPLFSETDRAALAFAEEITVHPRTMRAAVKERLKAVLTDAEIVDLTLACCMFNFLNRFNHVLEIERDMDVPDALVRLLEATPGSAAWSDAE